MKWLGEYKRPLFFGLGGIALATGFYFQYAGVQTHKSYVLPCLLTGVILLIFGVYRSKKEIYADEVVSTGSEGFLINTGENGNLLVAWNELKAVRWNRTFDKLSFVYKSGDSVDVSWTVRKYRGLLMAVPAEFSGDDIAEGQRVYRNLKTCPICGRISVTHINDNGEIYEECKVCVNDGWTTDMKEKYPTEKRYIREMQLEYFMIAETDEDFYKEDDGSGFELDRNWKPSITVDEVMANKLEGDE